MKRIYQKRENHNGSFIFWFGRGSAGARTLPDMFFMSGKSQRGCFIENKCRLYTVIGINGAGLR